MGMAKAAVLPLPVLEQAMQSRPIEKKRGNRREKKTLPIRDCYAHEEKKNIKNKIKIKNRNAKGNVFIPAGCMGELQSLDLSVNDPFKSMMKKRFAEWYTDSIKSALDAGESLENVKVDLKASAVKPRHANWLISVQQQLSGMKCLEDDFAKLAFWTALCKPWHRNMYCSNTVCVTAY